MVPALRQLLCEKGAAIGTNQQARSLQKKPSRSQLMVSLMKQALLLSAALGGGCDRHAGYRSTARQYPWCSRYAEPTGVTSCSFNTYGQCMQIVSGIDGYCYRNPSYEHVKRR